MPLDHSEATTVPAAPQRESAPPPGALPLIAAATVTLVTWAGSYVAITIAARELSPAPFALARLGSAALVLLAARPLMRSEQGSALPRRRDLPIIAFMALLGFPVYHTVLNAGQRVIEPGVASLPQAPSGTETYYDAGLDALWELDFFGHTRRGIEAAGADYEASLADERDVAVIVAAEVARSYVELRGAQYRLDVAIRNAVNQEQTLELTRLLLDAGRGTELDVSRAEAQLETTRANIAPLEATVARAVHRLGVLVGQKPTALSDMLATAAPLPNLPATVAVGDPAGLLRRRADIRAAERRLAAATARVGIATADLFPRVSLVGSAGYLSTDTSSFGDGNSERSSIGPFLSWPAFDLGRVRARIDAADATVDGRLAAYEQTVLRALEETENSLVGYTRSHRREARLEAAAAASENAVDLSRTRYHNGVDSFLNVLDAERRLFEAQNLLAEAETDTALAFIALYKALGGAWSLS